MLRLFLLLLSLNAALSWSRPATFAQDNDNDEYDYQEFDDYIDEVIEAADVFWRAQAQRLGFRYKSPDVRSVAYDERVRSKCGRSRGVDHSYCDADATIYLDYDSDDEGSLWSLWLENKPFVIVTVAGHEWGHHIQNLLGIVETESFGSVQIELQADCLMGVFARSYQLDYDWVESRDLRDAIVSTTESGDDEDTPPSEMTHGTADQRLAAFLHGYRANDVKACGI